MAVIIFISVNFINVFLLVLKSLVVCDWVERIKGLGCEEGAGVGEPQWRWKT